MSAARKRPVPSRPANLAGRMTFGASPTSRIQALRTVVPHRKELVVVQFKADGSPRLPARKIGPLFGRGKDLLDVSESNAATTSQVVQFRHVVVVDPAEAAVIRRDVVLVPVNL